MAIKIVADSMCDVPKTFVEKYGIKIMPLTVHFGDESFRDGVDITSEEFHKRLEKEEVLPTTSQVPPVEFYNYYKEELQKGNSIVSIHASSQMSGTYNSAVLAGGQLAEGRICVIDTQSITLGAGLLVVKAARMAEEGCSIEEIAREIEESKLRMKHFLVLDTIKYLYKGGRISLSASVLGTILNIKLILSVKDGRLELINKERGSKKALAAVFEIIRENGWDLNGKVVGINHITSPENLAILEEMIKKEYNVKELIKGDAGSVVATHGGPGAVALYFEV